ICIIHPDSIDARGDINLNSVPYEIADAVLYSNYFIFGLSVFKVSLAGQIAASDVNADGLTLSVADLVLLIRVIIGDAEPIPKVVPYGDELNLVATQSETGEITVSSDAANGVGAAWMVYDLDNGTTIEQVRLAEDMHEMDLLWHQADGQLRVLVYDIGTTSIPAGQHEIMTISYSGSDQLDLLETQIVDYQGRPYTIAAKTKVIPSGFALNQNYPNPFNPSTSISFDLPMATSWEMQVFGITGQLVHSFSGYGEAGEVVLEWNGTDQGGRSVASGIYFYRLNAADFTQTKKMVLLK
ncbi:MAG: T9SS type A sorting domain-containing protein, partial [Candidatus Zixiibacteriota bacterium]